VSGRPGLLDRLIARANPRWDAGVWPPPRAIADGLLSIERRIVLPGGFGIPTRSLVVRGSDGALVVISPLPDDEARRDVAALGPVAHLVAPNSFHHLGISSWAAAHPRAQRWLAPGLAARRPELPRGQELSEGAETPFSDVLPHTLLALHRGVSEVSFLHRPSRTLILTDACFHILEAKRRDRLGWRLLGVWKRFGPSLTARTLLLRDRARVADWLERVCRWDFGRIVVAHGEVLERASAAALREAFGAYK
jgi:hypothetical protein